MKIVVLKTKIIALFALLMLAFSASAHADFRKALDAYISKDGETMLKEVKNAVEKKNNDGLMLFLSSMNRDHYSSEYDFDIGDTKSGLKTMLSNSQWSELRELLVKVTNDSSVDVQYYLRRGLFGNDFLRQYLNASSHRVDNDKRLSNEQYSEASKKITAEYIEKGSRLAILDGVTPLEKKADAGDVTLQLILGMKYLHDTNTYSGCNNATPNDEICRSPVDETKGYYWLKRVAQSYESRTDLNLDQFSSAMCEYFRGVKGDKNKLRQAYLWAQMGINESKNNEAYYCLHKMQEAGDLKLVAPELSNALSDYKASNKILYRQELKELPDWIVEARRELAKKEMPVFEYAELEIYKDGRVLYGLAREPYKDVLMKVSPKTVQNFFSELKKTGFYEWTPKDFNPGICGDMGDCSELNMLFVARNGTKVKRLFFSLHNPSKKFGRIDQEKDWLDLQRMATIKVLVDKYFPTQHLRCGLGGSEERKKECVDFDNQWITVANWAKTKKCADGKVCN
jgi:hypothetical protein